MIPLANAPRPGRFPARVSQAAFGRNAHDVFGPSPVEICVRHLILRQCVEVLTARIICWALTRREGQCVRETMTEYDMPADGWNVFDMGGRPAPGRVACRGAPAQRPLLSNRQYSGPAQSRLRRVAHVPAFCKR